MPFRPEANQEMLIGDVKYHIAEHPAAPGMPYGQEGRAAVVYKLVAGREDEQEERRALKVFKSRYRVPALAGLAEQLASFAAMPGLSVGLRSVLKPQRNAPLLRENPDLLYAVLMPWIEGPTWMEALLEGRNLTPAQSLDVAQALAEVLTTMEQRGVAHCDLSGSNLLLPALTSDSTTTNTNRRFPVELVDLEQLYGPGLDRPDPLPGGSPGYAHRTAPKGLWEPRADRFAGAVLLAEMLGWCDERIRDASWGENYFNAEEMQQQTESYRLLAIVLRERWGEGIARLFERAWESDTLADCPMFGEWLVSLPESVTAASNPTQIPAAVSVPTPVPVAHDSNNVEVIEAPSHVLTGDNNATNATLELLLDLGRRFEEQGNYGSAHEAYREAQSLVPSGSQPERELALAIRNLEEKQLPSQAPIPIPTANALAAQSPSPESESDTQPSSVPFVSQPPLPPLDQGLQTPGRSDARPTRSGRTLRWMLMPIAILVVLLAFGGIALSQAQQANDAKVHATETAEANSSATAQAESIATQTAEAIATAQADASATVQSEAEATQQAQVNATAEAEVIGTPEARRVATAQAIRAAMMALPRSDKVISEGNKDAITLVANFSGHSNVVTGLAFSPDGQMLASGSFDKTVRLWHVPDGNLLKILTGFKENVDHVVFSPDGSLLATGTDETEAKLWGVTDGIMRHPLDGHGYVVRAVAFSPDGRFVVSASYDNTMRVWRAEDGKFLKEVQVPNVAINSIAFSPDGQTLALCGDKTAQLWKTSDWTMLRSLVGHTNDVKDVAFSPDGQTLASASEDYTVRLWRVFDGAQLHIIDGRESGGAAVAFSPDGQIVASGATDNTIRLWRVSDGALLTTLSDQTDGVLSLAFSPDGTLLASASKDYTIKLWGVK